MFTILCLLCLCGNKEYPGSFQNKSVSSPFKWVPKYILCLATLKVEVRTFWVDKHTIDLSSKLSLTCGDKVNYYKSVHHPIPTLPVGIGSPLVISKINQKTLLSFEFPGIFSSWMPKRKGTKRPFLEGCNNEAKGDHIARF